MQEEFVLVGGDEIFDRRPGVAGEPVFGAGREAVEFVLDGGGERGVEPGGRKIERYGFEAAELRRMEFAPLGPEGGVRGAAVEEGRDFPGSLEARVAAEDVEEVVEGGEGERVGGVEDVDGAFIEVASLAAGPEVVEAGSGDAFEIFIPEAVVEVDGDGDRGVEEIAAPGEFGGADQRREVAAFGIGRGDVAEGAEGFVSRVDLPWLEPEIEVALGAPERVGGEIGGVGEAFEDDEFEIARGEG